MPARRLVWLVGFLVLLMIVPAVYGAEGNPEMANGAENEAVDPDAEWTNWALGAIYRYSQAPNETYPDTDLKELTDGAYAGPDFGDPGWVGHLRDDFRIVTLDLGEARPIEAIRARFLQQWPVGIRFPEEVTFEVSDDGRQWRSVGSVQVRPHREDLENPVTKAYSVEGASQEARYVRVTFLVDVWVFIDEIEVLGRP